jgi:hypothetical protein
MLAVSTLVLLLLLYAVVSTAVSFLFSLRLLTRTPFDSLHRIITNDDSFTNRYVVRSCHR